MLGRKADSFLFYFLNIFFKTPTANSAKKWVCVSIPLQNPIFHSKYFKIIPQAKGFCNLHLNFIPISVPPAKNSSEKEKNYHYVFMNIEELYLGSTHSLEKIL